MQPVKKQLNKFVVVCENNEEYKRKMNNLIRVVKSEEWLFVVQILWSIKNDMASDLLTSEKYMKDDPQSKDITQKVYYNIGEWIDFLTNPRVWIAKKSRLKLIQSSIKGQKPERKEMKNGR